MKYPTASSDLAGTAPIADGDFLSGFGGQRQMARTLRLDPSTMGTLAGALAAQRLRNDPDTRKPWVEPTVTECATTNRRPATLTIAGVDLPNPAPPAPSIAPTADEIHNAVVWLRQRALMQPGRSGEFEVVARIMEGVAAAIDRAAPAPISIDVTKLLNDLEKQARWIGGEEYSEDTNWRCGAKGLDGKGYAADMRAASAEIQRQAAEIAELRNPIVLLKERMQVYPGWSDDFTKAMALIDRQAAELSELQGLLKEAAPAVRFVSELATLTDTEVDFMGVGEIRATARGKIGEPYGFTLPRLYSEADRRRAVDALADVSIKSIGYTPSAVVLMVDAVAEALGLQRAC